MVNGGIVREKRKLPPTPPLRGHMGHRRWSECGFTRRKDYCGSH